MIADSDYRQFEVKTVPIKRMLTYLIDRIEDPVLTENRKPITENLTSRS